MLTKNTIDIHSSTRRVVLLTLLCGLDLEIRNMVDECLLPPFPVTYTLLELLVVPLHALVIGEKLVDWRLPESQLTASMEDAAYVRAKTVVCHIWP